MRLTAPIPWRALGRAWDTLPIIGHRNVGPVRRRWPQFRHVNCHASLRRWACPSLPCLNIRIIQSTDLSFSLITPDIFNYQLMSWFFFFYCPSKLVFLRVELYSWFTLNGMWRMSPFFYQMFGTHMLYVTLLIRVDQKDSNWWKKVLRYIKC